jgi:phosphoglycerol transferase MdoB-like AlkP superfamily enzyme
VALIYRYLKLLLYWFGLFTVIRLLFFITVNFQKFNFNFWEALNAFHEAFRLDLTLIYILIGIGEIILYQEWKTKLNMQAVSHFTNPAEVFKTSSIWQTISFFVGVIVLIYFANRVIKFITSSSIKKSIFENSLGLLFSAAFCGTFFRGGWQPIPIQESDVCYSTNLVCNDLAINPLFSFGNSAFQYTLGREKNQFQFTDQQITKDEIAFMLNKNNYPIVSLSKVKNPNLIFIVWESASADCSAYFGGDNYTPNFDLIASKGLSFTNCIATGNQSDQGMPGIFSGHPTTPSVSLINQTHKNKSLPSFIPFLKNKGYQSAYFFGGQLAYGNIKSYLIHLGFERLIEEKDIKEDFFRQRLGYCDGSMSTYYLEQLKIAKQPFVYSWFTLSSHMPYDIPMPHIQLNAKENGYLNSMVYTDSVLGQFIKNAESEEWYKNSLIIIIADHSHNTHKNRSFNSLGYYRIPLVITGGALTDSLKGIKKTKIVSQTDLAGTLLRGINADDSLIRKFEFSRDLFANTNAPVSFCYYAGGGLAFDTSMAGYDLSQKIFVTNNSSKGQLDTTKKWLQYIYDDYLKR